MNEITDKELLQRHPIYKYAEVIFIIIFQLLIAFGGWMNLKESLEKRPTDWLKISNQTFIAVALANFFLTCIFGYYFIRREATFKKVNEEIVKEKTDKLNLENLQLKTDLNLAKHRINELEKNK